MTDIAVARFGHEGNSFASVRAGLGDFRAFEWARGEDAVRFYRGTSTEIGGAVAFFEANPSLTPHYLRCTFATPSGEMEREAFETIMAEILEGLSARRYDGVYLGQHGAMQVEGIDHADHEILRRVRAVIGDTPLVASYDLHANISRAQLDLCDATVGYKCHPHTDMAETAQKALDLLVRRIRGEIRPVTAFRPLDAMLPSINARTTDGPMAEAAAFARAWSQAAGLLDLTVYAGYAYGDRAHATASIVAVADGNAAEAERAAEAAAGELNRIRDRLFIDMPSAERGFERALAELHAGRGPVAVIDAADYPGAGANADTPGLLAALIEARPDVPALFAFLWDPETVRRAMEAGPGADIEVSLGARLSRDFGPPITGTARVERLTDGRIVQTGPFCKGLEFNYGNTALLSFEGVRVILTEQCLTVSDPEFFQLHGVDFESFPLLAIKAKNQFRAAFRSVFATMIDVDVPGPAAYDFASLPFTRVPRSHYPFTGGPKAGA